MHCRQSLVSAVVLAASIGSALAQPQYVTVPSGSTDVNNGGTVVVGSAGTATFRWSVAGGTATYTLVPDGYGGRPHCSADGSVIVSDVQNTAMAGGLPATAAIAGRWTAATGFQNLGAFDGNISCFDTINTPFDTSLNGNISVGLGYIGCDFSSGRAFVANAAAGTMIALDNAGGQGARADCVSGDGLVVAGLDRAPETSVDRPAVWRYDAQSGSYVEYVLFTAADPLDEIGSIEAINGDGTYVAGFSAQFPGQLVRWTWDGATYTPASLGVPSRPAGVPPEAEVGRAYASAMSSTGDVVIGSVVWQIGFFDQYPRAVMWTPATGLVDLTDYMISQGIVGLPQDTVLQEAYGISPDGGVVLGGGFLAESWIINRSGGPGCVSPVAISRPSTAELSRCTTTAFLNVGTAGSGPFSFQWRRSGVTIADGATGTGSTITGANTNRMIIENAGASDATTYDCVITNACGAVNSAPVSMSMLPATANDTCETATDAANGTFPLDFCGAYNDTGSASCAASSITDVWFRYSAFFDGDLRISLCDLSYADSVISVFDSCGGTQIACNNDFCFGTAAIDRLPVTSGQVLLVRIAVSGDSVYEGSNSVAFSLALPPPANDRCANATPVGEGAYYFESGEASVDGTASCRADSGKDVWFAYTPSSNGTARFETCGSMFDTVLSVYSSCGGAELGCNDNSFENDCWEQSIITGVPVLRTASVIVRVGGGWLFSGGSGALTIALTPSPCTADFNGDSIVNSQDFFDFLAAFFASAPTADFNGDNTVNSQDFFDFITAFFNGC